MRSLLGLCAALLSSAFLAAACGAGDDPSTFATPEDAGADTAPPKPPFDAVTLEPENATLRVPLGGPSPTQEFRAFATIDGARTDITSRCNFRLLDESFGGFVNATFTAAPRGGRTEVTVVCQGVSGKGSVSLTVTGAIVQGSAPQSSEALFRSAAPGTDAARIPVLEYPLPLAILPRNIPPVEAQWRATGSDLFRVSMRSRYVELDVYTNAFEAQLEPKAWETVLESAAGEAVAYAVEALAQATPGQRFASTPALVKVSRDRIENTALYYWASSQGQLMTQTFGETGAPTPVKGDCTSCHTVSRSGSRIGYSRCLSNNCNELWFGFMKYDTTANAWADTSAAEKRTIRGSYGTFAPLGYPYQDDSKSLAIVALDDGKLNLYDPDTGNAVASNLGAVVAKGPTAQTPTLTATMPNWSPDGRRITYAATPNAGQWIDPSNARIAVASYTFDGTNHVFGEPTFVVPDPIAVAGGSYNNFFFPSFSPDGKVIVFNAARAPWRNFTDARAPGQRLMLADADGKWAVDLPNLNGTGDLDITWPNWAPTSGESEYLWVVFSSQRDYGHRVTLANTNPACKGNGVIQCKQVWIAALDRKKLAELPPGGSADPSAAPVWMPGQDTQANNISPYWTRPTSAIPR